MADSRKCYYFVEGILTKDSCFQDYARRYDSDEQFRATLKTCQYTPLRVAARAGLTLPLVRRVTRIKEAQEDGVVTRVLRG
jgi:hypothetical protein